MQLVPQKGSSTLLLPFINRADETTRQTTGVSVSPAAWENYFVLVYTNLYSQDSDSKYYPATYKRFDQ